MNGTHCTIGTKHGRLWKITLAGYLNTNHTATLLLVEQQCAEMNNTPLEQAPFHWVRTFTVFITDVFFLQLLWIIEEEFEHHVVNMIDFPVEVNRTFEDVTRFVALR
ncbi:hypothetical protein SDC9_211524 [bioreactor metagenome]|uniref:Uncharacterized protein n=1 Tax=bioreactor metagenome TaxID=1076179 RepID=A0A645JJA5_9ZZZZ